MSLNKPSFNISLYTNFYFVIPNSTISGIKYKMHCSNIYIIYYTVKNFVLENCVSRISNILHQGKNEEN